MKLKSKRRTKMLKAAEPKRIPQFFFTAPMHPTSDAKLIMREKGKTGKFKKGAHLREAFLTDVSLMSFN